MAGESKEIESISATLKVKLRLREPSPMDIVNLPPAKLTILPLKILPSLSRIVSANVRTETERISKREQKVRKNDGLSDIFPPRSRHGLLETTFKFLSCKMPTGRLMVMLEKSLPNLR